MQIRPGVRYVALSAFSFSVMGAMVKLAGERLPSQEIVLIRAIISLVLSYTLLRQARVPIWGQAHKLLLLRGFLGFCGLSCVFYALTHLPIAEATVIKYSYPVFTAPLAALVLGEAFGKSLIASIALSFTGLVLVARPGVLAASRTVPLDNLAIAIACIGAVFIACAYVTVRHLSKTEHPLVIIFYFPLVAVPLSLLIVWPHLVMPNLQEWLLLLAVGVSAQLGQVYLTQGMKLLPAGQASAISYMQIVFSALWGMTLFAEVPDPWTIAGSLLILSGVWITAMSRSTLPQSTLPSSPECR